MKVLVFHDNYCHGLGLGQSVTIIILQNEYRFRPPLKLPTAMLSGAAPPNSPALLMSTGDGAALPPLDGPAHGDNRKATAPPLLLCTPCSLGRSPAHPLDRSTAHSLTDSSTF